MILDWLKAEDVSKIHGRLISALVICFLYDEASMKILLQHGLVPVLIQHFQKAFGLTVPIEDLRPELNSFLSAMASGAVRTPQGYLSHAESTRTGTKFGLIEEKYPRVCGDQFINSSRDPENSPADTKEAREIEGVDENIGQVKGQTMNPELFEAPITPQKSPETCVTKIIDDEDDLRISNVASSALRAGGDICDSSIAQCDDIPNSDIPECANTECLPRVGTKYSMDSPTYREISEITASNARGYDEDGPCNILQSAGVYWGSSPEPPSPCSSASYVGSPASSRSYSPLSLPSSYASPGWSPGYDSSPCHSDSAMSPQSVGGNSPSWSPASPDSQMGTYYMYLHSPIHSPGDASSNENVARNTQPKTSEVGNLLEVSKTGDAFVKEESSKVVSTETEESVKQSRGKRPRSPETQLMGSDTSASQPRTDTRKRVKGDDSQETIADSKSFFPGFEDRNPDKTEAKKHKLETQRKITFDMFEDSDQANESDKLVCPRGKCDQTTVNNILVILSRLSFLQPPPRVLYDGMLIECLFTYILHVPDYCPRAQRILSRLLEDLGSFEQILRQGIPLLLQLIRYGYSTTTQDRDREALSAALDRESELLGKLDTVAGSDYGRGVLAHILLTGVTRERLACYLALPSVCR